jgi:hypothetical protein
MTHYGMHRHFTDAGCVLLYGGGIKKGHLHGVTADERPCKTIKDRVVIEDLHATIYHAMGISPRLAYDIEQRPFYVTRDGLGKPITSLSQRRDPWPRPASADGFASQPAPRIASADRAA